MIRYWEQLCLKHFQWLFSWLHFNIVGHFVWQPLWIRGTQNDIRYHLISWPWNPMVSKKIGLWDFLKMPLVQDLRLFACKVSSDYCTVVRRSSGGMVVSPPPVNAFSHPLTFPQSAYVQWYTVYRSKAHLQLLSSPPNFCSCSPPPL